jgi:hypothetical protein
MLVILTKLLLLKWTRLIENAKEYFVDIQFYMLNCDLLKHWDYANFKKESEKNE